MCKFCGFIKPFLFTMIKSSRTQQINNEQSVKETNIKFDSIRKDTFG